MKTNVEIKILFDNNREIIAKLVGCEEHEDEYGEVFDVYYYEGIDGKTYYNHSDCSFMVYECHYNFVYHPNPFEKGGKRSRKSNRKIRVMLMTQYTWGEDGKFGRNRKLRRRMWPSVYDFRDAEEVLPF